VSQTPVSSLHISHRTPLSIVTNTSSNGTYLHLS
jgi:hypothetical protein